MQKFCNFFYIKIKLLILYYEIPFKFMSFKWFLMSILLTSFETYIGKFLYMLGGMLLEIFSSNYCFMYFEDSYINIQIYYNSWSIFFHSIKMGLYGRMYTYLTSMNASDTLLSVMIANFNNMFFLLKFFFVLLILMFFLFLSRFFYFMMKKNKMIIFFFFFGMGMHYLFLKSLVPAFFFMIGPISLVFLFFYSFFLKIFFVY